MKVKMKVAMTGSRTIGGEQKDWPQPGETLEVPDGEGAKMIQNGIAEGVKRGGPETATSSR